MFSPCGRVEFPPDRSGAGDFGGLALRALGAAPGEAYHWGTHAGAELDLLWVRGVRRWGFEVKYADSPRTTKSMRSAIEGLRLDRLFVIYPGAQEYELDERISVLPLARVGRLAEPSP